MDAKNPSEQEKDIRDLLRRAERTPVKTSALRRDTLKRLIDLAHSPHTSLKILAATNLKLFIKDFPDLEDDAINAVYDLCEDPVSNVRIKGYAAIVDVSREQSKWVKRNADVLVQLLQSDEPEEVTFVKRALTQHLDMDPVITLGVLCDQIVPSDEPLDEDEQSIRDRLRALVLAFLAGEAKRSLADRHASTLGSPAEEVLVSGLFKAITKLAPNDVDTIVKDIIAPLPSFKPFSSRGRELLDIILTKVRANLKSDLSSGNEPASLSTARHYLDIASFVALDKRLVHPSHLLRFYYATLAPKLVLGGLSEGDQAYVISEVARIFTACDEVGKRPPPTAPAADLGKTPGSATTDAADDVALRRQFPDVCAVLLQVFADMKVEERRPWTACQTLVQGIARRKRDNRWQIPQHIEIALRRLESLSVPQEAPAEDKAAQAQARSVIRSLLEPVKPPAAAPASRAGTPSTPSKDGQKGNVHPTDGNGAGNGITDASASTTPSKGDQRRVMNVNKRKLDATNGPASSTAPDEPGSLPASAAPKGLGGTPTRPASLPPRPSPATVASSIGGGAPSGPRADRQRQVPSHLKGKAATARSPPAGTEESSAPTAGPSTGTARDAPAPSGSALADDGVSRGAKRPRTEERRGNGSSRRDVGPMSGSVSRPGGERAVAAASASVVGTEAAIASKAEDSKPIPSLLSRLTTGALNAKVASTVTSPGLEREQPQRDRDRGGRGRGNRRDREMDREKERDRPRSAATQPIVPAKRRADAPAPTSAPSSTVFLAPTPSNSSRAREPQPSAAPDKVPAGGYSIRGAARAASQRPPGAGEESGNKGVGSLLERLMGETGGHASDSGRRKKRTKQS